MNLKSKCTWKQTYQPVTLSPPLHTLLHILLPTSIICPPEGISSSLIQWARLSEFTRLNPIWFGNVLELYWWKRWIWKLDLGMGMWDNFGFKSGETVLVAAGPIPEWSVKWSMWRGASPSLWFQQICAKRKVWWKLGWRTRRIWWEPCGVYNHRRRDRCGENEPG